MWMWWASAGINVWLKGFFIFVRNQTGVSRGFEDIQRTTVKLWTYATTISGYLLVLDHQIRHASSELIKVQLAARHVIRSLKNFVAAEMCSALLPRPLAAGHGMGATCVDWGPREARRSKHPVVRVNLLSLQILLSDCGDLEKKAKIGKQTRGSLPLLPGNAIEERLTSPNLKPWSLVWLSSLVRYWVSYR